MLPVSTHRRGRFTRVLKFSSNGVNYINHPLPDSVRFQFIQFTVRTEMLMTESMKLIFMLYSLIAAPWYENLLGFGIVKMDY